MRQVRQDVPGAGPAPSAGGLSSAAPATAAEWLALADPDGPIDLARLFPDIEVVVSPTSGGFTDVLAATEPRLVVLIAPPADVADISRLAAWRAERPDSCVVLLSPHQAVSVRLHALEMGFDDAVDMGADPMEVVGRLSIAGRRSPRTSSADDRITVGDGVELDLRARAIRREGRLLTLRPKELALLEFLAGHPGRAFSRDELLRHVWRGAAGYERMVDVYVFWLRAKIETDPANPAHLLTVRGSGYLFEPPGTSRLAIRTGPER